MDQWIDTTDIVPYNDQVGGHKFTEEKPLLGLLKHKEGYILKSVEGGSKGKNEVKFYEELQKNEHLAELKKLVPSYYDMNFIILEDITRNMKKPCVMDVKIGVQTWEPGCSEKKKRDENTKYRKCKEKWSFCIPGFQVYDLADSNSEQPHKFDKEFGKKLNPEEVVSVFKTFLNFNSKCSNLSKLVHGFAHELDRIRKYFENQRHNHFYSSSVLLAYDADSIKNDENYNPELKVSLIDFAHVIPANQTDVNYLDGISNLWQLFQTQLL
ncbi:uncharacterized protein LOC126907336 isoform X2 [Daktulosphaira vitifoliae]|uniref:uncharacterized protein LOC126907336 isoform X2 n=1 Tax=Daktulosphaira vitifoliae TaxID=58002 RepID=UPI0021AA2883|nr:uncharacterized protein LOC126907336 isoform X2 [Daktulosphaira vitifoliae]